MLRPHGVTVEEIGIDKTHVSAAVRAFRDEKGYDIRVFNAEPTGRRGRRNAIYKCVGKFRWDGSYRSFVTP